MSYTFSLTINRQFVIGLVVGLILGSCLTIGGAWLIKAFSKGSAERASAVNDAAAQPADNNGATAPVRVEITLTDQDHILGDKNAPVVMVVYSDFQCPYCQGHHSTLQNIIKKYGDKIALVYRNFPLSFHENAKSAALAAECASEQGKFWEYSDGLFAKQDQLGAAFYNKLAADLKLDTSKFSSCYTSGKYSAMVDADLAQGQAYGVSGTPATFINGTLVSGAIPQAQLEQAIDQELQK